MQNLTKCWNVISIRIRDLRIKIRKIIQIESTPKYLPLLNRFKKHFDRKETY